MLPGSKAPKASAVPTPSAVLPVGTDRHRRKHHGTWLKRPFQRRPRDPSVFRPMPCGRHDSCGYASAMTRRKPHTPWKSSDGLNAARARCAMMITTACIVIGIGCNQGAPPAPPPPAVLVTQVIQKDVPITAEWVGTTVGFVNAKVMPRVQGYLLKQDYEDG